MSDPNRPTVQAAQLTNAHREPPPAGANVWALTHGGRLVETVWKSDSIKYFDAWTYYPKIPQDVKDLQSMRNCHAL